MNVRVADNDSLVIFFPEKVFLFGSDDMQFLSSCKLSFFKLYTRGLHTTARRPNAAREAISSGPRSYFNWSQRHFANN